MPAAYIDVTASPYNADPTGVADARAGIQSAADAAFKTGGVPNGKTNWQNNKPLHFPPGLYRLGDTVFLDQVYKGLIFGQQAYFACTGSFPAGQPFFKTNGFEECRVDRLNFQGSFPNLIGGSGAIGFDLDWNGLGTVQLQNNNFKDIISSSCLIGIRIANQNHGGNNNNFVLSRGVGCGWVYYIVGSAATDNVLWASSGASDGVTFGGPGKGVGVQCDGGSFISHGNSLSSVDYFHIVNSPTPCLIAGNRMEVGNVAQIGSGATLRIAGSIGDSVVNVDAGGLAILDALYLAYAPWGKVAGNGSVRIRGSHFDGGVDSTVTILENI